MRIRVAIPTNNFLKFEVIYRLQEKKDIIMEHVNTDKILRSEIGAVESVKLNEQHLIRTPEYLFNKIVERLNLFFPHPITYRLWIDNNCYIEEIKIE